MPASLIPASWQIPDTLRKRLGEIAGRQRAMSAEGHLLLVLHAPPLPGQRQRESRLVWRDDQGTWRSAPQGGGLSALRELVQEFADRIEKIETDAGHADSADELFAVLRAISPVHRTVRNQHVALQQAREMLPDEREIIVLRDRAGELERAAELLHQDAVHGLDFTVAKQAEEQTEAGNQMAVAAHRLNVMAAIFLPIATLSAVLGMNVKHGLEGSAPPLTFLGVVGIGFAAGLTLSALIVHKPAKKNRP
ncbi:MAG: hypothetical protein HYS13_01800 [Planctomycetia bacterium]|nr:hypothetical protein [Planctomycetia bacterium]